ncbi:hypothetical protein U8527_05740 [Kordia algicida OT-1]|uniref:Uncharacterized protein n=1 Tax=Kordia algicida OT-1 TaxID=391587 RepID=A9E240_9FLAO|nr:hypothetical protein [Kordia algicida]EDP95524.1 hypothetical protein KAOT1_21771 [Kordia algicida OT-1]
MKKRNLKKIGLNKKVVSTFRVHELKGGALSDLWHQDEDGYYVCCSAFVC